MKGYDALDSIQCSSHQCFRGVRRGCLHLFPFAHDDWPEGHLCDGHRQGREVWVCLFSKEKLYIYRAFHRSELLTANEIPEIGSRIRVVLADGTRRTLDNDVASFVQYDATKRMWTYKFVIS